MNGNTRTVQEFGDTVGTLLLKMLPFALATISPTMIGLVVIFLTGILLLFLGLIRIF